MEDSYKVGMTAIICIALVILGFTANNYFTGMRQLETFKEAMKMGIDPIRFRCGFDPKGVSQIICSQLATKER